MNISSSESREPLIVPSMHCQSLLGKAIQEHFTKSSQIASIFSSSPSLQNSSAGANFLSNFKLDEKSSLLFSNVFTPEDCFSCQFSTSIQVKFWSCKYDHEETWRNIFFVFSKLTTTKFLAASLFSLSIATNFITDEQLNFILSNLKRINKLELDLVDNKSITSEGLGKSIAENLSNLSDLRIYSCSAVTDSVIELFASKLNRNIATFKLVNCNEVTDEGILAISKTFSLNSISFLHCGAISSEGYNHLASLGDNVIEMNVHSSKFDNKNFQEICSNFRALRRFDFRFCGVSSDATKSLKFLENLEYLCLNLDAICDDGVDHVCCLKNLSALDLSHSSLTDKQVEKICFFLGGSLRKLILSYCKFLTVKSCEHLKKLEKIEEIFVAGVKFSTSSIHALVMARRVTLKTLVHDSSYSKFAMDFLDDPSTKVLNWKFCRDGPQLIDEQVDCLLELIGDDHCLKVEEIDLHENASVTKASLDSIAAKFKNLQKIDLRNCTSISPSEIKAFKAKMPQRCNIVPDVSESSRSCTLQ